MSKKKPAFLKEENLLTLFSQNNFIVPEIQREYVWGENEEVISKFLNDLKEKIGGCCESCHLPTSTRKINIGFLYSYKPDYVKIEHERYLDENLIDGQQRFTTLFLLLFYCAIKERRKDEFLSLLRFEEKLKMSFDYRVRDLTRRFLLEFVEKINNVEQLSSLYQQTWFLTDYENDVSIGAMCKALGFIQNIFSDEVKYYNHLSNYIVFWHFKTEATSQGEELYITMNARGEELADNEVAKAALMIGGKDLYDWGRKWEEWQQLFWKNRDKSTKNSSADQGFNGFLSCIAGLEYYLNTREGKKTEKDIQKLLSLDKVENYYNCLKYLLDNKAIFVTKYNDASWVDKCFAQIWSILNSNDTDWFADYRDANKGTEMSKMVFLWSILHYLNTRSVTRGVQEAFRVLRLYYIRFNNFNRSVNGIYENIAQINEYGPWLTPGNSEENLKHNLLSSKSGDDICNYEELVWQIEDHPLNLDGRDVGNINLTHLVDLDSELSLKDLQNIKDSFYHLFPNGTKNGSALLKTTLLHYGEFWRDTSYYYKRYDFSEWNRNIRKPEFKIFFKDTIGKSLTEHLEDLKEKFLDDRKEEIFNSNTTLPKNTKREKLIYYSVLIPYDILWRRGEKIMICNAADSPRLFEDENEIIYNSRGTFRSQHGNADLWIIAKELASDPLDEIKKKTLEISFKSLEKDLSTL